MNEWLITANPAAALDTESRALKAARWSAIALWLASAVGLVQTVVMWMHREAVTAGMQAAVAAQAATPEEAAMAQMIVGEGMVLVTIIVMAIFILVQAGVGVLQWKMPNRFVPLIFLLLAIYGIVSTLVAFIGAGADTASMMVTPSVGLQIIGYVSLAITTVLQVSGVRGSFRLHKFRTQY